MIIYAYAVAFIAGEVKRPDKSILLGNLAAILVPGVAMVWLAAALYNAVGFEFLKDAAGLFVHRRDAVVVPRQRTAHDRGVRIVRWHRDFGGIVALGGRQQFVDGALELLVRPGAGARLA